MIERMKLLTLVLLTAALLLSSYAVFKTEQLEQAAKPQMRLLSAR
jgi:hypothetical protein